MVSSSVSKNAQHSRVSRMQNEVSLRVLSVVGVSAKHASSDFKLQCLLETALRAGGD